MSIIDKKDYLKLVKGHGCSNHPKLLGKGGIIIKYDNENEKIVNKVKELYGKMGLRSIAMKLMISRKHVQNICKRYIYPYE